MAETSSHGKGIILGVVAVIVIVLAGCLGCFGAFTRDSSGDSAIEEPARTPEPTATTEAPVAEATSPSALPSPTRLNANAVPFRTGKAQSMFNGKLIIKVPRLWTKMKSDTDVDWRYADKSDCDKQSKTVNCPSVRFSSLTTTASPDLLEEWADTPCKHGYSVIGQRSGPISYTLNGEPVDFYTTACHEGMQYAWHFNAHDVLVTTHFGSGGEVTPEIVEAVLAHAKWD